MVHIGEWSFDFGKEIAKIRGIPEVRFRMSGNKVFFHNGSWWERWAKTAGTTWDGTSEKDILDAYEHWLFERIVLK